MLKWLSMRHWLLLWVLLLLPAATIAAPQVKTLQPVHQFEAVLDGDIVTHHFDVRNTGDAPLHLRFVKVGCDCTRVLSFPETLAPGQSGAVAVELNTKGFGGTTVNKDVIFESNDPAQPNLTLTLSGNVDIFATITPSLVKLEGLLGNPVTQTIRVAPTPKHPFTVTGLRLKSGQYIECRLNSVQSEGQTVYELAVDSRRTTAGRFFDTIFLQTDHPQRPEIAIRVFAYIQNKPG